MPLSRVDMFANSQKNSASSQTSSQVINQSSIVPMTMENNPNSESARTMSVRDMAKQYEELHCRHRRPDRPQVINRARELTGFPGRHSLHPSRYANFGLKQKSPETKGNRKKARTFLDTSCLPAKTLHPLNGRESDATPFEPPLPKKAMMAPPQHDSTSKPESLEVSMDNPAVCNAILQSPVGAMETSEPLSPVRAMKTLEPRSSVSAMESSPVYEQTLEPRSLDKEMEKALEESPGYEQTLEPRSLDKAMEELPGYEQKLEPRSLDKAMEESLGNKTMDEALEHEQTLKVMEAPFASEAWSEKKSASDNSSPEKAMDTEIGLLPTMDSEARILISRAERNSLPLMHQPTHFQPSCLVDPAATTRPERTFFKRSAKQPKGARRITNLIGLTGRRPSKRRRELSMLRSKTKTAESVKTGGAAACPSAVGRISETPAWHSDTVAPSTEVEKNITSAEEQEINIAIQHSVKKSLTKRFRHWLRDTFFAIPKKNSRRDQPTPSSSPRINETGFCGTALDVIAEGHSTPQESIVEQSSCERQVDDSQIDFRSTLLALTSDSGEQLAFSAAAASENFEQLACSAAAPFEELSRSSENDGTTSIQGDQDNHENSVTTSLMEPFVRRNISEFIAERGAALLLNGWKPGTPMDRKVKLARVTPSWLQKYT